MDSKRKSTSQSRTTTPATGARPAATPPKPRARTARPEIIKKPTTAERIHARLQTWNATVQDPQFWSDMRQKMPPWADEMGALLLLVLGIVTLTALFNTTSEAHISVTISDMLRQFFGYGAFLVSLAILAAGIWLLLPKFGITLRLNWSQMIGIEVAFGSITALLHLSANDPAPRLLAQEGKGGGYLGWTLSQSTAIIGSTLSLLLFAALLTGSIVLLTGLRRYHISVFLAWLTSQLEKVVNRLDAPPPALTSKPATAPMATPLAAAPPLEETNGDHPITRRPHPHTPLPVEEKKAETQTEVQRKRATELKQSHHKPLSAAKKKEIVDEARRTLGATNGRSLVAPGDPGERQSIVPRDLLPDSRAVPATPRARVHYTGDKTDGDSYFTVNDFREVKKIAKREENLPPLELLSDLELNKPTEDEINTNARIIKNTLLEFDLETEVIDVKIGPTVTQYAVSPYTESVNEAGETVLNRVRVGQIASLNGDLALALSAKRLRIQAPVPGHSYVGVEVPNRQPSTVALRPVLESAAFYENRKRPLALPLGRDVSGEPFITDLQTMPHLLIAGTTGSGKSIMLAAMTTALIMNNPPDRVKLVLLDPKMVELPRFNGLPHLLGPVETELDRIIGVLRWCTREMDLRYKLLEKEAARNLETYNKALGRRRKDEQLPYIVVIIDEIGDLMMQRPDETERALTRLAQMARAVGIHLMVATQRPSVDVITGLIKANFPARISFAVASSVDSRVILDATGADSLMGRGDMLFLAPDAAGPQRIQGCYISDEEVNAVVNYWRNWHAQEIAADLMEEPGVAPWERGLTRREVLAETDPMLEDAIALVIAEGEASASLIQRRLGLGYPRAARIMDLMQELGIIGASKAGGRSREVLIKPGHDPFKKLVEKRMKNR